MKSAKAALSREGHKAAFNIMLSGGEAMPIVNVSLQVLPGVPEERIYPVVDKVIELIAELWGEVRSRGPWRPPWKVSTIGSWIW